MSPLTKILRPLSLIGALVAMAAVSAQAETFTGATSSNPTVGSNYSGGTAPTFGGGAANPATDQGTFLIQNQGNNPFVYSAALGTTVFSAYTYTANTNNAAGLGTLNVTGGSLSFGGNPSGSGSQNVLGDGIVNLSGGMLSFLNGATSDGSSLWIGNNSGNGTVNVTGGTLLIQNGIIFGRDGATGVMNLTAGLVQTGGPTISFSNGSRVNFSLGSTAQLSLNGATTASLQALVTAGDIYINGAVDTNTADYQYTASGAQGILSLPVPEPSTWAMIGVGLLLLVSRRRGRAPVGQHQV